MSTKSLNDLAFYRFSGTSLDKAPDRADRISGSDTDGAEDVIDWAPTASTVDSPYSRSTLYLEVLTTGYRVTAQGRDLVQGTLSSGVFSTNNWVDLTTPITLTIEAEDGTTKNYTVGIRKQ